MIGGFSFGAVALLGLIAFNNYRNGTLSQWLGAKFLNKDGTESNADGSDDPYAVNASFLTPTASTPATGLGSALGGLITPVVGKITGLFGESRPGHQHAGIDYAVPIGTDVHVARAGVVSFAGNQSGYGLIVIVDHGGGVNSKYGHLSKLGVKVGQSVQAGDVIGKSGNTGDSTGPHLHFELTQAGKAIDPNPYLGTPSSVGAALTAV